MHLTDAMTQLATLYPETPLSLRTEALLLVASNHVAEPATGIYSIRYGKDGDEEVATVEAGACDCDPLAPERQVCAHVIAASLYALLQEEQQSPLDAPFLERHVEKIISGSLMAEAPYSASVTVQDGDGYDFILTVRKQEGREFFEAVTGLRGWIKKQGFTPKQWRAPVQEQQQRSAPTESSPTPPAQTGTQRTYLFHAATLHRNEMDNKILWAVKGADIPRYNAKYGMRIWDEVLTAAGFDVAALTRMPSADFPSLVGWTAEYVNKEGEDKPDKIIFLRKGA